ncbi:MAG TPA: PEGA domain-containing protein [Bryobacteraceae bacterium]|nr:PEGA domain-containing protein [Bryobacteraceae bacterium]
MSAFILPAILAANVFAAKDKGYIKASGNPEDAAVFINGKYVGPASRYTVTDKYQAPLGQVEVTIRDPRCQDYTTKVMVAPGKTVHVHYKLARVAPSKPPYGTFRLTGAEQESYAPAAAGDGAVYLNNKYYGYVDELKSMTSGILLNPGTYNLFIDSGTYGSIRQQITIQADKTTLFRITQ